mmetsp:Transcript_19433/g.38197  ORF Transcript_19433/g.38197 Transcript_19433/m.38197 type:complete len:315 (+) Transcript_19433:577-1521(+)
MANTFRLHLRHCTLSVLAVVNGVEGRPPHAFSGVARVISAPDAARVAGVVSDVLCTMHLDGLIPAHLGKNQPTDDELWMRRKKYLLLDAAVLQHSTSVEAVCKISAQHALFRVDAVPQWPHLHRRKRHVARGPVQWPRLVQKERHAIVGKSIRRQAVQLALEVHQQHLQLRLLTLKGGPPTPSSSDRADQLVHIYGREIFSWGQATDITGGTIRPRAEQRIGQHSDALTPHKAFCGSTRAQDVQRCCLATFCEAQSLSTDEGQQNLPKDIFAKHIHCRFKDFDVLKVGCAATTFDHCKEILCCANALRSLCNLR